MEYGSLIFPFNNYLIMSSLDKIQYKAIRLCLGIRRTTPTNIILAEAGKGPLVSRFYFLTAKYILKIFSLDKSCCGQIVWTFLVLSQVSC